MGGQKPQSLPGAGSASTNTAVNATGPARISTPRRKKVAPRLSIVHHSATRTKPGTFFVVKAKSAYSDPVVVANSLLFVTAAMGLLNVDVFNTIFSADPAHKAAGVTALVGSLASVALRIFYSKSPVTLKR